MAFLSGACIVKYEQAEHCFLAEMTHHPWNFNDGQVILCQHGIALQNSTTYLLLKHNISRTIKMNGGW